MKVETHLDSVAEMQGKRGLQDNGRVQKFFTMTCAKEMDPYVPMQKGILKNTRTIGIDTVTFNMPYARFQYNQKVMVGVESRSPWAKTGERKKVTEKDLTYHGAPTRGAFWDKRMWADKKTKVLNQVAAYAGGRPGL